MTFKELLIAFIEEQDWVWREERTTGPLGASVSRITQKRKRLSDQAQNSVLLVRDGYSDIDTAIMVCSDGAVFSENGTHPSFKDNLHDPGSLERIYSHIEKRNIIGRQGL